MSVPASLAWRRSAGGNAGAGAAAIGLGSTTRRIAGIGALVAAVAAATWIAAGVASTPTWLELPTRAHPGWIEGPLRGLGGSLSGSSLNAALIVLAGAYLVALWCAPSIPLRLALGTLALANLAFTLGPPILSSDVFGYIAYARELGAHGLNPYLAAPTALGHDAILPFVYWKHETSPYGPLFTVLSAPLGLPRPAAALWAYKALAGLAAVTIACLVARLAPQRGIAPSRAAIFVGLNPVALFYAVSGGHNDLFAVAVLVGALAFLLAQHRRPAAAAAVAAAAIKVTMGLALPFVLLVGSVRSAGGRRRGRAAGAAGPALASGWALAAVGIPAVALFGTHLFDQLHRITTDARFDIAWSGPDLLARALGTHITTTLRTVCTAAAGAVALAMLARAWRGADPIVAAGWAFMALLASIASLAPWYLVWLLPFAALGRSRALWVATLLVCAYVLGVHLPALGGEPWLSRP